MPNAIFRQEALEALKASEKEGALLRLIPGWTRWAYWLVVLVVLSGITFSALASVPEYASGPAIIRVENRMDLTTPFGGVVSEVFVKQGQRVETGQVLIRFAAQVETQEVAHAQRQFELELTKVLTDPNDEGAKAALSTIRAAKEAADRRLRERSVFAPKAGIVGNLRIRPGQTLAPGDFVLALLEEKPRFTV